jgi:hypothetical protein
MKIDNKETRVGIVEFRAASENDTPDGRLVEGYAALFDSTADLGWFMEIIEPKAFDSADMSDVRALFNHDPNQILARSSNKSLTLSIDERGLKFAFVAPNTTIGNDCLENIRTGLVSQCSFAFTVEKDREEKRNGKTTRIIERVGTVYDVSPVTYPAYPETSVSVRSRFEEKEENQVDDTIKRKNAARKRRLSILKFS